MSTGKVKAVLFIIIGLLVVALVCSWLAGKDNSSTNPVNVSSTDSSAVAAATPAPGENAPTTSDGTSSYTGNGSNAALNGYITGNTGSNSGVGTTTGKNNTANNNNNANTANNTTNNTTDNGTANTTDNGYTITDNGGEVYDTGKDSTAPNATPAPETAQTENVPAPEPEADFVRRKLGGTQTFRSNEISGLALSAEVSCETISSNQVEVKIELFAESYSIYLNENYTGAGVRIGDVATYVSTSAVRKDSNNYGPTSIGTKTFIVEITDGNTLTLPIAIEWYYNGNYSGTHIDTLECGGNFTITRA